MSTGPEDSILGANESVPTPETYGPDMFYSDITVPDPTTVLNEPMPRAWGQGGIIEAVKTSVITGLREAFTNTSMNQPEQDFYISIEYPTQKTQYPGIWVQFSIDSLKRAGLGMETWTQVNNVWGAIQEWMFEARITLTIAAETSKDRDRLADTVLAQLAFARGTDLSLRQPRQDANQMRGLIAAIDNNPYVSMTLNTDIINPGGQTVTAGTPWAPNVLLYEDNYSFGCQGQFNLRFSQDGVYTLAEIRQNATLMGNTSVYNPAQWLGTTPKF